MGLLIKLNNGDTSFKSLKFGKDRPGGGDSGQPYVQTSIGDQAENTAIDGDGIIRGGLTAPSRALEDATRLSKYFFDFKNPNGILFTVKQNLLSRIAAKAETASGPAYGGFTKSRTVLGQGVTSDGFTEGNGAINEGIYTPLSTIMQAQVGYLGQHVNKMGLDPTGNFENAAIKKYGDVVFERNKANRNGEGPVRSIIPFNLIRKEQRANKRLERATLQQDRADSKAAAEQNRRPEDRGILFGYATEEQIQGSLTPKALERGNRRLKKWDDYRDQQTQKRLKKKNAKVENAEANKQNASKNVEESYEENFQEVYYDNRLLNLWDSKGLNLSKPLGTLDSILYSYGGGPNSVVGVGQTDIKFATLNDGITPARTGYSGLDPYNGDYNYSTNNPIIYSTINIFGDPTNPNSVSLRYLNNNPQVAEGQIFGNENYLIDRDNSENIQPWLSGDYVRSLTGAVSDSVFSRVLRGVTWSKNDFNQEERNTNQKLKEAFTKRLVSDQTKTFIAKSPDYLVENQERRVGIGRFNDPGQSGDISDYSIGKRDRNTGKVLGPTDRINALPIVTSLPKDDFYNDFIRFRISILDPSRNGTKQHLIFRAFLDDLSDDYSAKWNSTEYIGRGEKFYKYQGFDRSVNVGFTLAALSKQELLPMYRKLNFLASSLAPSYSDAGYMAGNITELSVGDWFYQQPGILESVNVSIPEQSPWDIQIPVEGKEGGDGIGAEFSDINTKELPFILKVKMKFTPIHNFLPRIQQNTYNRSQLSDSEGNIIDGNTYGKERYIALGQNTKNNGYLPKNDEPQSSTTPTTLSDSDQNVLPPPDINLDEGVVDIID
jgi:regulator of protease activity HflC (stomatin/prohibitin superfamily)